MSEKAKIRIGPLNSVGGVVVELGRIYREARRGEMEVAETLAKYSPAKQVETGEPAWR